MAAMRIVEAFDEVEDRHARLDLGLEVAAVEQLAFQRGEEALAHGVVETVSHRAHRRPHSGLAATLAEGERSILTGFKRSSQHSVKLLQDTDARPRREFSSPRLFAASN